LASLAGKTVYLDFWFAGCAPCHQLFKDITSVKKYFKNDPDVVFLLVSVDEKQTWRRALNKFQIDGFHTFTENKLRNHPIIELYNVSAYPSTFIIDARGKFYTVNPSKNPEILKEQLLSARAQGSTK
jgi:cytochrome oxidase Cu insertion factor (SCO1/SenC/PrrC family)